MRPIDLPKANSKTGDYFSRNDSSLPVLTMSWPPPHGQVPEQHQVRHPMGLPKYYDLPDLLILEKVADSEEHPDVVPDAQVGPARVRQTAMRNGVAATLKQ